MTIVPQHISWLWFIAVLALLSLLTALGVSYIHLFGFLNKATIQSRLFEKFLGKKIA
jgi:hypothetical protein